MREPTPRMEGLVTVEKYDTAFRYLYNITGTMPRRHGVFRDELLRCMLRIPRLLYVAAKTDQVSRVREADAELATLRWHLRIAEKEPLKVITPRQHDVVSVMLAEVGNLLGGWMQRKSGGKQG